MSYVIQTNTVLPITIPDVSENGSGVMTPEMLEDLETSTEMLLNNTPQTQIVGGINSSVTTIPVLSTLGFASSGQIKVGNELINYTSISDTSFDGATRGVGGSTAATQAANVAVQQFKRVFVYANSGGNDETGDGSISAPFRTFQKACTYISQQQMTNWNAIWLCNLTGLGKEILPAEFVMPPFAQANAAQTPAVTVGVFLPSENGINFFATPTVLDTITDANIPCKVTDNPAASGATTINVVDTTGFPAVATDTVADNPLTSTATTVNVTTSTALFPTYGIIKIENELIAYSAKTATSFTGCQRGYAGTTAAGHVVTTAVAQASIIKMGSELMTYAGITSTSFTGLNRGLFGTTAASQALNTRVLLSEEDGMVKYVTNLNLADRQNKFILGAANNQFAHIANNTTGPNSIIEVPSTANFTAPFTICDASAEINRNTSAPRSAMLQFFSSGITSITFAGIKFTNDIAGQVNGIEITTAGGANFNLCDFDVAFGAVRVQFLTTNGCLFRRQVRFAGIAGMLFSNNIYRSLLRQAGNVFSLRYAQSIYDGCSPAGQGGDFNFFATKGTPAASGFILQNCRIRTATSYGVQLESGGKGIIANCTIKGCVSGGVRSIVPGLLNVADCYGYGNGGIGILADDGGHILLDDARTGISGTSGDMKCGNMSARTLVNFRGTAPIKNEVDAPGFTGATTDTVTLSRIWQP